MRPIDADELKKDLTRFYDNEVTAKQLIDEQPTIEPEQRWIPCSERLPEKEGWYITTVESEKTGKRRIENDLFAVDIALAHGHTPNKFCKDGYRQRTVAWMPFPEPYQGEGEQE